VHVSIILLHWNAFSPSNSVVGNGRYPRLLLCHRCYGNYYLSRRGALVQSALAGIHITDIIDYDFFLYCDRNESAAGRAR